MNSPELTEVLKKYLGDAAWNDSSFEEILALSKAVRYFETQMNFTKRWCTEEGKEHIDKVIAAAIEILTNTKTK